MCVGVRMYECMNVFVCVYLCLQYTYQLDYGDNKGLDKDGNPPPGERIQQYKLRYTYARAQNAFILIGTHPSTRDAYKYTQK